MTQVIIAASNALHIDAILDFFRDIKKSYIRSRNISQTKKELGALTDKELWDIGISRGEIHDIAVSSFPAETNKNLGGWV
jgi:uncharacterized protein YjiS (DUF1127 family)